MSNTEIELKSKLWDMVERIEVLNAEVKSAQTTLLTIAQAINMEAIDGTYQYEAIADAVNNLVAELGNVQNEPTEPTE